MLTQTDFISLPYTSDLTIGGMALACQELTRAYEPRVDSTLDHVRLLVSKMAVELAFRRYLGEQSIPYSTVTPTPFTGPGQYKISLGGHHCRLANTLISNRQHITRIRRNPGLLLKEPVFLPADAYNLEEMNYEDIYLFAILLGLSAASHADEKKALDAGQPIHLIHGMPERWIHPDGWVALKQLSVKSECERPITIEIGGKNQEHTFISRTIELPSRQRVRLPEEWFSIAYIHATTRPDARIGLHSPVRGAPHIIRMYDWVNIWLYGMEIILTGWITRDDFHRKARTVQPGTASSFLRPPPRSLAVSTTDLEPIAPLLTSVQAWEAARLV